MKRLLVIGGTRFVGRALVEEGLARGWHVTMFHRGQTGGDLFADNPNVAHVHGDRNESFDALGDQSWDAMIDACAYFPHQVERLAAALVGRVGATAFVSTISVYGGGHAVIDESTPVMTMPEGVDESVIDSQTYGPLKAQCEEAFLRAWPNALIARAGLQIGPHDHTCRFSDWVERIGRRKRVVVPFDEPMPWQQIDTRDMAAFILDHVETGQGGIYNLTGHEISMDDCLDLVQQWINPACIFVHEDPTWLAEHGIEAWKDLALWLPADGRGDFPLTVSIEKALAAGLTFRPLETSVREIWARIKDLPTDRPRIAGLSMEREDALLAAT